MDTADIKKLIQLLKDNHLSEIEYSDKDKKIRLRAQSPLPPAVPKMPGTLAQDGQPVQAAQEVATNNNTINAPSVGVFYSAKSPQEPPYVKVGDQVHKGDVVGVIEVMKAFTDVIADRDGVVEKVLVNNEEGVEYGQPLIQLK